AGRPRPLRHRGHRPARVDLLDGVALPRARAAHVPLPRGLRHSGLRRARGHRRQIAHPDRQVLAVLGDGGFMFSVNELATAVKYGLGIVFLVLNDQRYGAIKYLQEGIFGKYGEVDLANPDFPTMARAFGAEGVRAEGLEDLPRPL